MNNSIFLVDDDGPMLESLTEIFEGEGFVVRGFTSAEELLDACAKPHGAGCIVLDINLPGMDGLQAQAALAERGIQLPVIFLTGHGDVPMSVRALKSGAIDFMEKPVPAEKLVAQVRTALHLHQCRHEDMTKVAAARARLAQLTKRETEILLHILLDKPNKQIAKDVGISMRTVEVHRRNIILKTGARSLLDLANMSQLARACTEFCSCARSQGCRRNWQRDEQI